MSITDIKSFSVLPLSLPSSKSTHYLFFKKHDGKNSRNQEDDSGKRSLFFYNLPINTTTAVLKRFFQEVAIGCIIEKFVASGLTDRSEDIWIDLTKLTSDLQLQRQAHVGETSLLPKNCGILTFIDKASFSLAFTALKKLSASATNSHWPLNQVSPFGSAYLLAQYHSKILDESKLSIQVSQALVDFDKAEKESREELHKQTQLVDEDGFTLVVGSHRKTKAGILGQQKLAATVELEKAKTKMKKKEKEDFYRFQLRQRKKDEMNDLLRKFKLDQEKVRLMKEKKRFRPS